MAASTIKLFIAMPAPPVIHQVRLDLIRLNQEHSGIKWVPAENLHITVFFLGFVASSDVAAIKQVMESCLLTTPGFTLHLAGIMLEGGRRDHPSMIWARFERDVEFSKLAGNLGAQLKPFITVPLKFPDPIPHITLARIKHRPAPATVGPVSCEAVFRGYELWQSIPVAGGVRYETI